MKVGNGLYKQVGGVLRYLSTCGGIVALFVIHVLFFVCHGCLCYSDSRLVLHPDGARRGPLRQAGLQEPDRERPGVSLRREEDEQTPQELPR